MLLKNFRMAKNILPAERKQEIPFEKDFQQSGKTSPRKNLYHDVNVHVA
ncbi:hypothetical protein NB643_06295 [Oxalobacter aliiformigenes]|uniref:Uncharacterized protein n=1 Tax=Oxalobacter aliiformigenes TaxID=2946593 RepID=A0ABY7JP70_9BURK|nr:hypothetical protein [Oxalobacter aliiformigenes]WAV94451.1 hypothetical protein NB643_06295 [Oxalobacter aliiformigenes]WAV97744.1 hypothetical protein NB645_03150 [Oxalobacter aliiformigenes]